MPDLVVHNAMGDRVLERLPKEISSEIDRNAFHVGVLGPDPFFFYRFFFLPLTNGVDKRGKTMHRTKCRAFLLELARECCNVEGTTEHSNAEAEAEGIDFSAQTKLSRTAFSYLAGFLCHYALDSTTHPYINKVAAKRQGMHTAVERKLDRIELKRQGKQLKDIMRLFVPFPDLIQIRTSMKAVYGWDDDYFRTGYKHMNIFLWFIKDQHGMLAMITGHLSGLISKVTGQNTGFIRAVSYRNHMGDDLDVGGFDALEHKAVDFAVNLITTAEQYRTGQKTEDDLAVLIGNHDYSGRILKE